jgi:hypothetical protein
LKEPGEGNAMQDTLHNADATLAGKPLPKATLALLMTSAKVNQLCQLLLIHDKGVQVKVLY